MTDFVYGLLILHGTYDHQLWLDVGWIGFYILWGAAALHPVDGARSSSARRRATRCSPASGSRCSRAPRSSPR